MYNTLCESGFSGFSTYYTLKDLGINCIVIDAADVPATQYEEVMKTDNIDAVKLVKALRKEDLRTVYIREKENLDDRSVVRIRKIIQKIYVFINLVLNICYIVMELKYLINLILQEHIGQTPLLNG